MTITPTTQQNAIYDWFERGKGHLVVEARAGSGKTSTLLEGVSRAPDASVLVCAYNKRIADELTERIAEMPRRYVTASTLHSLGLQIIRRVWPQTKVEDRRTERIVRELLRGRVSYKVIRGVVETVYKVKEVMPFAETVEEIETIASDFGTFSAEAELTEDVQAQLVLDVLQEAKQNDGEVDFSDMVWLPIVHQWSLPFRYRMVAVDEAQDVSPVQLLLARKLCVDRFVMCGDPWQCLYSWRGADQYSMSAVANEVNATRLPLTTSFRCAKTVIQEAKRIVADIEAAPWAEEGEIDVINYEDMRPSPGDFVLSRTNAPLVSTCLMLREKGIDARIEGTESLNYLLGVIERIAKRFGGTSVEFEQGLRAWTAGEIKAAQDDASPRREDRALDVSATITSLLKHGTPPSRLGQALRDLHQSPGLHLVTCSTVHKAKGLEAEQVFLLMESFKQYQEKFSSHDAEPFGMAHEEVSEEEFRIEYVGITRARKKLVWVSKPGGW